MTAPATEKKLHTLDPEDQQQWQEMRQLGHRMLDDMFTWMETIRERKVWQPIPAEVRNRLKSPLPEEAEGIEKAYEDFTRDVLPYPLGNPHPHFWGWVKGNGTPGGVLAEMVRATMNANVFGGDQSPHLVEEQVIAWLRQMLQLPATGSGILGSGGSTANLMGLTVARNAVAGLNPGRTGLLKIGKQMTVYCSAQTHSSIDKSMDMIGIGVEGLRHIPVTDKFEIDLDVLRKTIADDRAKGMLPICIIANAGTVNTGASDDINAIADICEREGIWLHIDGAFGALAAISPKLRGQVAGLERADSIAFDLHKWMYMQYGIGCTLFKSAEKHRAGFNQDATYLSHNTRGMATGGVWFSELGFELSRGFRGLKAWMSLKEHGAAKYRRLIEQNVEQAQYLAELVRKAPELELLAPVPLNLVCFRYVAKGLDEQKLNTLNQNILFDLQEQGIAAPTSTVLNGKFAIRVAHTNYRTTYEDFDRLVREVVRLGKELSGK
jgi:aromatic-L-amino-acid/L-tryptophan decarboxylase